MNRPEKTNSNRIIRTIIFTIIAAICYSIMTLLVKLIAKNTTESMTVFFRTTVSLFWIILVLNYKKLCGKEFSLKTKHFGLHLIRATSSFISMFSLYYALRYVPLADATSLAMTYTLFIPILSLIVFGTKTNIKTWLALIAGFVGITFILKPYSHNFNPITLIALISGITTAISLIGVYELAKDETPYTIMVYFFSLTFVLSGICTIFSWKTPDSGTLTTLLLIGITGTAYQELITRAMSYTPPKIVAPLLYFNIVFGGLFDWIFWRHAPSMYFWFGTLLIALGCIFSIKHTEHQ